MKKVYLNLENCYGIKNFEYLFSFDKDKKAYLIYAPNGTMKTSFANTLKDISEIRETRDYFYPLRKTKRILKYDNMNGEEIENENILVIESYSDSYKSQNMHLLLIDDSLKEKYSDIYSELEKEFKRILDILRKHSGKKEVGKLLTNDFGFQENEFYSCLENIYDNFSKEEKSFSSIKYSKIFTADLETILKDKSIVIQLEKYIEQYEKLISASKVFEKNFNHTNAEEVIKNLDKGGFFKAKHKVMLAGETEALDEESFKKIVEEEKKRIIDVELQEEFQKIDSLLSAKSGTKELREYIFENKEIIRELINLGEFKKKVWNSYLAEQYEIFENAVKTFKKNKRNIEELVKKAKEQESEWHIIVELFNERFSNMPFKLRIKNKDNVILNNELPIISFLYNDKENEEIEVLEETLLLHLSNGEKKALYLLNIIFEIEARKKIGNQTLLIIDDIADSFDYRNKYAIIEYMKDIINNNIFLPIILTHNFDFYRTVAGRLNIKQTSFFVGKTVSNIELIKGEYFENVFDTWRSKVYTDDSIFISSIAFVRNIIEYIYGRNDDNYIKLTSLLHYKNSPENDDLKTENITVGNISEIFSTYWGRDKNKFSQTSTKKVIDLILEKADEIYQNSRDLIHIENKIVLCIAIRLLTEKYMISKISDSSKTDFITGNQTRKLYELLPINRLVKKEQEIENIVEKVLIVTSENIHINSFMYEPIVDMSLEEIKDLYIRVKTTLNIV